MTKTTKRYLDPFDPRYSDSAARKATVTNMTTQHAPTPWYITGLNPRRNIVQSIPLDSDNYICECDSDNDAAFIVRAVNNHDALVNALEEFMTAHEEFYVSAMADDSQRTSYDEAFDTANAALAQAKG